MYSEKIVLHFPSNMVDKPIVYKLSRDFDLEFNILKATVIPNEEGILVLELKGDKNNFDKALKYLEDEKVKIKSLSKEVTRDENLCVHCGLCIGICPASAFEVEVISRKIIFNQDKCIACGMCVNVCPYKAMEIKL
ncbi:MAG: 4Fe-4S binding protein [Candidatus Omnitrophica bacterium]|nr:4Fe-4S binding protein [Candidatus Omnitrophota bacterium]MCK5287585.1 4Fe-4S binding protein [Candidatus Omnitrophota bacterium]MCK5494088.1 4Fe-4S binding protein [Candidatus Omnitrophota bacterium]